MEKTVLDAIGGHQMIVVHSDGGVHRHIRFRNPKQGLHWFDVVTWPHHLAISGDVEGHMFQHNAVPDMFDLFRRPVDPEYLLQKLAAPNPQHVRHYSAEVFERVVLDIAAEYEEGFPGLGQAVRRDVLLRDCDDEQRAREFLFDFRYHTREQLDEFAAEFVRENRWMFPGVHPDVPGEWRQWVTGAEKLRAAFAPHQFRFEVWDLDFSELDYHFRWVCHAIRWAVGRYDESVRAAG